MAESLGVSHAASDSASSNPSVALNNFSISLRLSGNFSKAEQLLRCSIVLSRRSVISSDPSFAALLANIGAVYAAQRNFSKAESFYKGALSLSEKSSYDMDRLAAVYVSEKKYNEAEEIYTRSIAANHDSGEPPSFNEDTVERLSNVYVNLHQYTKAEQLLVRLLHDIDTDGFSGENSLPALNATNALGNFYLAQKQYAQSKPLFERGASLGEEKFANSFALAIALNGLAINLREEGKFEEAERVLNQSQLIVKRIKGEDSPDFAASLRNMASIYRKTGRIDEARALETKAAATRTSDR